MAASLKPSAADRRRPTLWDGLAAVGVLMLAGVLAVFLFRPAGSKTGGVLTVTKDGQELARIDLAQLTGVSDVDVPGQYPLTISVSRDGAAVVSHTCPDGDCARATLSAGKSGQLICLPNRTVITLRNATSEPFDAVTG